MRDPRVDPKAGDVVVVTEFGPHPSRYEVSGRSEVGVVYLLHCERRWMTLRGWRNLVTMGETLHAAD